MLNILNIKFFNGFKSNKMLEEGLVSLRFWRTVLNDCTRLACLMGYFNVF